LVWAPNEFIYPVDTLDLHITKSPSVFCYHLVKHSAIECHISDMKLSLRPGRCGSGQFRHLSYMNDTTAPGMQGMKFSEECRKAKVARYKVIRETC
jgi:hypothetical protein